MDTDRRRHERHAVEKLCKIYDPASRRYAPARTRNISRSGALVTIQWARPLEAGDAIDIVIAWSPRPLLPADAMVRARVARTLAATGEVQTVALEFDHDLEAAIAA
jgi:hypothetical protein